MNLVLNSHDHGLKTLASPTMGIICGGLNAYCMQTRPLFLRTSGSSGVPKALLLERNGQLTQKTKKTKKSHDMCSNSRCRKLFISH